MTYGVETNCSMDNWRPINSPRFENETEAAYRQRTAEIREIITGFRKGHFQGPLADVMEARLLRLQDPLRYNPDC